MRICVACGRRPDERPLRKLPLAMSPDLGICITCEDIYHRRSVNSGIQREADRVLATDKTAFHPYLPQPTCKHCGANVLYNTDGSQPLWCQSCEWRRMQIATGVG